MAEQIRVLYVDDDEEVLGSMADFLTHLDDDMEVLTEKDPETALDRVAEEGVDCLVSDYRMAGMDGLDFLQAVREEFPSLPFIFYTGRGSESVASEAISNDATGYVQKTANTDDYELLRSRIRGAVSRHRERVSYQELFENVGVGMCVRDIDTYELIEVNQAYCDLLGYDREALRDLAFEDLTADRNGYSGERARELLDVAVEEGEQDHEWPYLSSEGEVIWADVSHRVGEIRGRERIITTVQDITDRKRREREIERRNALFAQTEQIANVGAWEVDLEAEEGWWTAEVSRIYGLPLDYDPGIGDGIDFFHPDDRPRIREAFDALIEDGESYDMELRLIDANDEQKWVRVRGEPVYDGDEIVRVRGTIQDITERKEREEQLRSVKERLDLAVEGANVGVWDWEIPTNTVTVNEQFSEIAERPVERMEPTLYAWWENIHPDDRDNVRAAIEAYNRGEAEYYDFEYRLRTGAGDWKWIQTVGRIVEHDDDGIPLRAVGIHLSVNERKRYEQRLKQQRDNLETLNEMVRHDIRNDLQLVLAYVDTLRPHVEDEGEEYLETALQSAQHAVDLTKTARDLAEAMLQADTEQFPVSLTDVLRTQVEEVRSAEANAVVTLDEPPARSVVLANEMLDSVFRNLLQNAIEHNDKNVPEVAVSVTERDEHLVVHVADNGPGIPDEQKEDIFVKGEKGLDSEGSGIGLYLVETLTEQYGGDVWVEDNDPEGAVFNVELPRAN